MYAVLAEGGLWILMYCISGREGGRVCVYSISGRMGTRLTWVCTILAVANEGRVAMSVY